MEMHKLLSVKKKDYTEVDSLNSLI